MKSTACRRSLKIEEATPYIPSQIRLKGNWLADWGFHPGQRVTVTQTGAGRLELCLATEEQPTPARDELKARFFNSLARADALLQPVQTSAI